MGGDAEFLRHEPCEKCGSKDNLARYSDGHGYCFGCGHLEAATEGGDTPAPIERTAKRAGLLTDLDIRGIKARHLSEETCRRYGYGSAEFSGDKVQVASYRNMAGEIVAQKIRTRDKKFRWLGEQEDAVPFGWHETATTGGKLLVVTEGEIDAMSMSQAGGNRWPVVSIGCGAGPQIKKYISKHRALFQRFDTVVLLFDMDEPGRTSAQAAAEVLGSKARIAEIPLKDANEMLVAGRVEELLRAQWNAQPYRPDGIVEMSSLKDAVLKGPEAGFDWFLPELTQATFGRRYGEIVGIGAGTGVGKSTFMKQSMTFDLMVLKQKVGAFCFEESPTETALNIAGKAAGKPFHVSDGSWDQAELIAAWDKVEAEGGKLFLYDAFGVAEWDAVRAKIEYLYHTEGVRIFYIDHLTALAEWQDDERKALEQMMPELASLAKALDIWIGFVSHLATPEGKPHEEGGRVMLRHFKGSRAIAKWAHFAIGIEGDQQADDPDERHRRYLRILKDRKTGRGLGQVIVTTYDSHTGWLSPVDQASVPATAGRGAFASAEDDGTPGDF